MKLTVDARMIESSGIGVYLRNLLEYICRKGYDIRLLGPTEKISRHRFAHAGNVRITEFNEPIYSIKEQLSIGRLTDGCDLFWSPHFNVPIRCRARRMVVTIHDTFHLSFPQSNPLARGYAKFMYRRAARRADLVLTVSEFSKKEIVRHTEVNPGKVRVVLNGVTPGFITAARKVGRDIKGRFCAGKEYILFVGNLKPNKNLPMLLEAFARAVTNGATEDLLVVGKTKGFRQGEAGLEEKVARLGLSSRVHFAGEVSPADLLAVYAEARMFVMPSYYEGFGLPILEAMAAGTPVLASNAASLPEAGGDAVVYCDPYDDKDIADKMLMMISDRTMRETLIAKGLARASELTWERAAEAVVDSFEKVSGKS